MYMWISTRPPRHPCLCSYLWYTRTVAPPLQGFFNKIWQKKKKKKKKQNCAPKPFASLYYLALWWWAVPLTLLIIQCTWTILEFNEKILTIKPPPKWVLFGPYSVDYGERNCIGKSTTAQLSGFILNMSRPSAAEHKYSYSLASEYQNPSERKKKFRCKR